MSDPYDIESPANPRVRSWLSLSKRSGRDRTGTFIIEGVREVARALDLIDAVEVIVCPPYAPSDVDLPGAVTVSRRVFDKLSNRQHPDGVALIARQPDHRLSSFSPPDPALVLVGDGIEKPGNIGAILRTCDAFGAAFLGASLGTDLTNPNVVRSAQGSLFSSPIATADRGAAIDWCVANTSVVVAHPYEGGAGLWSLDLTPPTSIVIGAEHEGVHGDWLAVGAPAFVPMRGAADSLNASVTAGIFLAEAVRQNQAPR